MEKRWSKLSVNRKIISYPDIIFKRLALCEDLDWHTAIRLFPIQWFITLMNRIRLKLKIDQKFKQKLISDSRLAEPWPNKTTLPKKDNVAFICKTAQVIEISFWIFVTVEIERLRITKPHILYIIKMQSFFNCIITKC